MAEADRSNSQAARRPSVWRFLGAFALWSAGLYALLFAVMRLADGVVYDAALRATARLSGWILTPLASDVRIDGASIASPGFSVIVAEGCDPLQPIALFAAGALAFPVPWRRRLLGVLLGAGALTMLNVTRIVSLFLIGLNVNEDVFETIHYDVWQPLFVLLALALWLLWALRLADPPRRALRDAASESSDA